MSMDPVNDGTRSGVEDSLALPNNPLRSRRFFLQWLKASVVDIVTMAILGAIALALFKAPPVTKRSFPLAHENGDNVYPQFAYPYRDQFIPNWAAALLAVGVPILGFAIIQIRLRSFWDFHNAMVGLLYSLLLASLFQLILKWAVGGLRPHFLATCRPDPSMAAERNSSGFNGVGYGGGFYNRDICTNPDKRSVTNELQSFPSGHSASYFAGFVFLSLYLNAKLKVFADYQPALWKLMLFHLPFVAATVCAGTLVIDDSHNWYDVLVGGILGTFVALTTYRIVFASLWDSRYNHIPLNRNTPLSYDADGGNGTVFTRRAGWGSGSTEKASDSSPVPVPGAGLGETPGADGCGPEGQRQQEQNGSPEREREGRKEHSSGEIV